MTGPRSYYSDRDLAGVEQVAPHRVPGVVEQRELDAPAHGVGGIPSDYLRQRRTTLLAEAEQAEAEIAELSGLSGDALVWQFCKADIEAAQQVRDMADAGVTTADLLSRGAPAPYRAVRVDTDRDVAVLTRARQQGWHPNLTG